VVAPEQQSGSFVMATSYRAVSYSGSNFFLLSYFVLELKPPQTPKENKFPTGHAFEIILPNLIHKSKKRNLPRPRRQPAAQQRSASQKKIFSAYILK
jgi:hypothetical protein